MDDAARGFVDGLHTCFDDLPDPRIRRSCDHLLFDLIAIAVLAVMCGADSWTDLEIFAQLRLEWLRTFLVLPGGAPSHDTFRRVFGLLDRQQFAACLFRWTQALHAATGGKLVAIDGKTLRRSFAKKSGFKALHLVTAWASENGLTLAQVACEEKSNEITAIPELLPLLDLKGSTVTIDAMGCQKEIIERIRDQRGHYVVAAKDNQPRLCAALQQLYEEGLDADFVGVRHTLHTTTETAHGRRTERTYEAVEIPAQHPQRGSGATCGRRCSSPRVRKWARKKLGRRAGISAICRPMPSRWAGPSASTGASKMGSIGCWTCNSAKTPLASRTGAVPPT